MRALITSLLLVCPVSHAESEHDHSDHDHCDHEHHHDGHPAELSGSPHHPHLDLDAEDDAWFHFHPHLSAAIALGGSTSEKNLGLIAGGHAPIDDGFNLQGIELGAVMEFGEMLSAQTNYHVFWDRYDHWDGEWEEAFLALDLPSGISLRGGQFLMPFGYSNQIHLHDREFVEPPITIVRLLGEDGLYVQGADLAFHLPGPGKQTVFRLGYGQARPHSHGFSKRELRQDAYREALEHAGEDDHDDHDDDDHGDDHDEEEHAHGFAGNGGVYDVDDAYLDDGFFFARLESDLKETGWLDHAGVSFAGGQNGFGRTTWIVGADLKGSFEIGDRPAWWRAEAIYRYSEAYDAAGAPGHFDETGIFASCGWEFVEDWTAAARVEWASGNRMAGLERRWRASANVSRAYHFSDQADLHTRLQYSYDDLGGYGNDHSIWLQFVLNLGAAEHGHDH